MTLLNISEICPATRALGPGKRFVIWVQGCCFQCQGCISPDWIPQKQANLVDPHKLATAILSIPSIEGLTVSGGEPMLQATALYELFRALRKQSDLSIICFTGFTLPQLQAKADRHINQVLKLIDVLIDGQYISELNDNKGWRGSSNQAIHHLSSRYQSQAHLFTERKRDVEVHLQQDAALMVGVPPQHFSETFKTVVSQKL